MYTYIYIDILYIYIYIYIYICVCVKIYVWVCVYFNMHLVNLDVNPISYNSHYLSFVSTGARQGGQGQGARDDGAHPRHALRCQSGLAG